jgi:hypothetical protein
MHLFVVSCQAAVPADVFEKLISDKPTKKNLRQRDLVDLIRLATLQGWLTLQEINKLGSL